MPGVNCQERTHDELVESLKATLKEAIEFNKQDAVSFTGKLYKEEKIAV